MVDRMIYTLDNYKNLPSTTGVYKILNKITGKFYIGSASCKRKSKYDSGFKCRFYRHIKASKRLKYEHYPLYKSFNKYGLENFEVWILCECSSDECLQYEQLFLNMLCPFVDYGSGYNICKTAGSSLGYKHTEKSKNFLSKLHKGKTLSQEHKDKLSKNYYLINLEGEVFEGSNLSEFARCNNLDIAHIHGVMAGNILHHKGWTNSKSSHLVYKAAYELRGITKSNGYFYIKWMFEGNRKTKACKTIEEAITYRDNLEKEGICFIVKVPNWKQKVK